jgi:hypothetical protein
MPADTPVNANANTLPQKEILPSLWARDINSPEQTQREKVRLALPPSRL